MYIVNVIYLQPMHDHAGRTLVEPKCLHLPMHVVDVPPQKLLLYLLSPMELLQLVVAPRIYISLYLELA